MRRRGIRAPPGVPWKNIINVPISGEVTSRRVRKEPKRNVSEESDKDPLADTNLEVVCAMKFSNRVKWITDALMQAAQGRLKVETIHSIIMDPMFIEGAELAAEGSQAKKMKSNLEANMHVFSSKQQKALKLSVISELDIPIKAAAAAKKEKHQDDSRERSRHGRKERLTAAFHNSPSPGRRKKRRHSHSSPDGSPEKQEPDDPAPDSAAAADVYDRHDDSGSTDQKRPSSDQYPAGAANIKQFYPVERLAGNQFYAKHQPTGSWVSQPAEQDDKSREIREIMSKPLGEIMSKPAADEGRRHGHRPAPEVASGGWTSFERHRDDDNRSPARGVDGALGTASKQDLIREYMSLLKTQEIDDSGSQDIPLVESRSQTRRAEHDRKRHRRSDPTADEGRRHRHRTAHEVDDLYDPYDDGFDDGRSRNIPVVERRGEHDRKGHRRSDSAADEGRRHRHRPAHEVDDVYDPYDDGFDDARRGEHDRKGHRRSDSTADEGQRHRHRSRRQADLVETVELLPRTRTRQGGVAEDDPYL